MLKQISPTRCYQCAQLLFALRPNGHWRWDLAACEWLRQSYAKEYVDQVERQDILNFMTDCYKQGLGSRRVYDKLVVVLQLFKRHGKTKLIESNDWPDYVDTIRPIYEADEIVSMLGHADRDESSESPTAFLVHHGAIARMQGQRTSKTFLTSAAHTVRRPWRRSPNSSG